MNATQRRTPVLNGRLHSSQFLRQQFDWSRRFVARGWDPKHLWTIAWDSEIFSAAAITAMWHGQQLSLPMQSYAAVVYRQTGLILFRSIDPGEWAPPFLRAICINALCHARNNQGGSWQSRMIVTIKRARERPRCELLAEFLSAMVRRERAPEPGKAAIDNWCDLVASGTTSREDYKDAADRILNCRIRQGELPRDMIWANIVVV
ncbi:MAG TPA: hypothetical protein VGP72_29945 [Planctomycetota bacterium]|jgi:hypothetical protein